MNDDHYARCRATDAKMRDPNTADNMAVRLGIMADIKSGKITLAQGQAELAAIQRQAKKLGLPTAYGQ